MQKHNNCSSENQTSITQGGDIVDGIIKRKLNCGNPTNYRSRRRQQRWEERWFKAGGGAPPPPPPTGCFSDAALEVAIKSHVAPTFDPILSSTCTKKTVVDVSSEISWADRCKLTVSSVKKNNSLTSIGEKVIKAFSKIVDVNLDEIKDNDNRYILKYIKNNFLIHDNNMDKEPYVKSTAGDGDALWKVFVQKCLRTRGSYAGNPIKRSTTLGTFVDRLCSNDWQARWIQHVAGIKSINFLHQWGTVVEAIFFVICDEFSEKKGILIVNTFLTHCENEFRNVGIAGGSDPNCNGGRRSSKRNGSGGNSRSTKRTGRNKKNSKKS